MAVSECEDRNSEISLDGHRRAVIGPPQVSKGLFIIWATKAGFGERDRTAIPEVDCPRAAREAPLDTADKAEGCYSARGVSTRSFLSLTCSYH